jgi:hypothetical protein
VASAFDIVVVPDFRGERIHVFEPRTLFFLASWMEHGGRTRDFPMHVACIGEPPSSVRWLAQRCGARVSVHSPLSVNRGESQNKLRGLEIRGRCPRMLLLDTDVLVLADFSELAELGDCVAAKARPGYRVPDRYWQIIYAALGLPVPIEPTGLQRWGREVMFPYYNSGVVFAPWACGLRPLWEEHMGRIAALFDEEAPHWPAVGQSDQAAFATTLQMLGQRGVRVVRLPEKFNEEISFEYGRGWRIAETVLFHAVGFFRGVEPGPRLVERGLRRYRARIIRKALRHYWRRVSTRGRLRRLRRQLVPTLVDLHRLGRRLDRLHRKHVAEALHQNARVSSPSDLQPAAADGTDPGRG